MEKELLENVNKIKKKLNVPLTLELTNSERKKIIDHSNHGEYLECYKILFKDSLKPYGLQPTMDSENELTFSPSSVAPINILGIFQEIECTETPLLYSNNDMIHKIEKMNKKEALEFLNDILDEKHNVIKNKLNKSHLDDIKIHIIKLIDGL